MFSDKGSELATQNKQLWNCFLRRFNDIEAAVRAECVSTCKNFILNHLKLSDVSLEQTDKNMVMDYDIVLLG